MSLESIRDRVDACPQWNHEAEKGSDYWYVTISDSEQMVFSAQERAEFIAHARTDIPLLLKVAEAAKKLDGFEPEDIDCEVWEADYQEAVKVLRAALAELEAGE